MKTADLKAEDGTLDWAAAQCEQNPFFRAWSFHEYEREFNPNYSTNWAIAGPIIEREKITPQFMDRGYWRAWIEVGETAHKVSYGPTYLIAAMRCYVASKLGDEVEIPEELK